MTRRLKLLEPWPDVDTVSSDAFLTVTAEFCADLGRLDLADRLRRFAAEALSPRERKRRRFAERDALILQVLRDFYPAASGFTRCRRMLAADLAAMNSPRPPPAHPKNLALRQIIDLNGDEPIGFEALKKIP